MCPACVSTAMMIATGLATAMGGVATVWKKSRTHDGADVACAAPRPEDPQPGPDAMEVHR